MNKNIESFFINNYFEFKNFVCHCDKDILNTSPGQAPIFVLKVYSDHNLPLQFSYSPQSGLNLSGNAGGILEENILGKLLALDPSNIDKVIHFFKSYGFFFPIGEKSYESINLDDIQIIIRRLQATTQLMSAIAKKNYVQILYYCTYLLYNKPANLKMSSFEYAINPHSFTMYLNTYNTFPDISRRKDVFNTKKIHVNDLILDKHNNIDLSFFNGVRNGSITSMPGSDSQYFKNLFAMYCNFECQDKSLRYIIDFYYNLQMECGILDFLAYGNIKLRNGNTLCAVPEQLRDPLLKIANTTLAEELNSNLSNISPQLTSESLTPVWQIDNLLQALYFSIFYMKPGVELYKRCENPNCKRDVYFLVKTTRTNKKYCCTACANAAAQQRSRQRKLDM